LTNNLTIHRPGYLRNTASENYKLARFMNKPYFWSSYF